MKRLIVNAATIIAILTLVGCKTFIINEKDNNKTKTDSGIKLEEGKKTSDIVQQKVYTIKDYYPFEKNRKYIYEGTGIEYASYTTWVDYIKGDRMQLRTNNGGTETIKVIENKSGELKLVFMKEEIYYRENLTTAPDNENEILLKEPIIKGTAWFLADGSKRYISNIDIDVTTAIGNFKAIEVKTDRKDSNQYDYYAPNIGLVKTVYKSEEFEVISALSNIDKAGTLKQDVRFYYPNVIDERLYYINRFLEFKTNDITKMYFEKFFKEIPSDELGTVLGPDVKIRSLYLSKDNIVYVDFSKELVTQMNAGTTYESMLLQSITNTLGGYYGVGKVYITIENEPYSSGHILMKKGEVFKVDTKDSVKIK